MSRSYAYLPSIFNNWSWESSNGNATDEQTIKAHSAVTNQGHCNDFSYLVWNDIVDLLYNALTNSNMSWDETYATYSETKMSGTKSILTAKMFNSVRHNLALIYNNWSWLVDKSSPGYIGRIDFKGFSDVRFDADFIFGHYFTELTRKLVDLITYLKGEMEIAEMNVQAVIFAIDSVIHSYTAKEAYVNTTTINVAIESDMETGDSNNMAIDCFIKADILANMSLYSIANMSFDGSIQALSSALSDVLKSVDYSSSVFHAFYILAIFDSSNSKETDSKINHHFSSTASGDSAKALEFPSVDKNSVSITGTASLLTGISLYIVGQTCVNAGFASMASIINSKPYELMNDITCLTFKMNGNLFTRDANDIQKTEKINLREESSLESTNQTVNSNTNTPLALGHSSTLRTWSVPTMKENGLHIKQAYSISLVGNKLEVE